MGVHHGRKGLPDLVSANPAHQSAQLTKPISVRPVEASSLPPSMTGPWQTATELTHANAGFREEWSYLRLMSYLPLSKIFLALGFAAFRPALHDSSSVASFSLASSTALL